MKTHWKRLIGALMVLAVGAAAFAPAGGFYRSSARPGTSGRGGGQLSAAGAPTGLNRAGQPADEKPADNGPIVILPDRMDVSPPLRDIPPIPPEKQEETLIRWNEMELLPGSDRPGTDAIDPNLQTWQGPIEMPSPLQNWEGINNVNGVLPPDTQGDVGPNHYIQWVNLAYAIYNKTGTLLAGPTNGNTLWSGFGGDCETQNDGDPITLYDHLSDRWFMSQFVLNIGGTSYQCIAVSQTADPTGAWYRYSYVWPNSYLNDYPHFGLWPDAYYLTVNQFNQAGTAFTGAGVAAYERSKMLTGAAAQMIYWNLGTTYGGQLPADWEGSTPPPSGAPGLILEWDNGTTTDYLRIWEAVVNWITPASSTLTLSYNLATTNLDNDLCTASRERCIPQPGGAPNLEAISDRLMHRVQYRNFGTHQALVGNHTVDADGAGRAGIHWFELRNTGSAWAIHQQGTYAPADGLHRWMGSITMDGAGNIALGYSASSSSVYPGIRYAGRLASDTLGTLPQAEVVMQAGGGSQTFSNAGRWGDYSAMQIDPADDCTFWYTQEYYQTTSSANWQTRIGSFKFNECGAPDFTISATPTSQEICVGANAQVNVAIGSIGGYANLVSLSASGNPGSAGFSTNPVTPPGNSTMTISGAAAGTYNFNVVGTAAGPNVKQVPVGLNVQAAAPAAPPLTAPANGSTGVATTPTFTWSAVAGASSYEIQVAIDPAFNSIVASAMGLTGTSWTPGAALASAQGHYWRVRAVNACGAGPYATLAAFVTSGGGANTFCASPNVAIPDNNTAGVNSPQTVAASGALTDLNVSIQATHTWVGDLVFTLTNGGTSTSVTVFDRPGVPATTFGCSGDNIATTLDDQAASPVESQCAATPPAINGTFQPNNPLSAFNGQQLANTWTMNASDRAGGDTGTLVQWCLIATHGNPLTADFSDLASTYGAAWHTGSGALRLGPGWTADTSFAADGDGATDDGVAFIGAFAAGQPATLRVNVQGTPASGRWLRIWFDWDNNGVFDTTEKVYDGTAVNGNNDLTVNVPASLAGAVKYRVRLYDSASAPAGPEAIDAASYGGASGGEVEDGASPSPLAVTLAGFSAAQQGDAILVAWETASELGNAGFNLYRGTAPAGPDRQLNATLIPSQAPGNSAGFAYTWEDRADLAPGATYYYWLEDVDLSGAATMHGPVSVDYVTPTAVTLAGVSASPATGAAALPWLAVAAGAGVALALGRRR